MGEFISIEKVEKKDTGDQLRIASKNGEAEIRALVSVVKMIDKDTNQHIAFIQSLNLTGYGETLEKAEEMLKFCISNFFDWLMALSNKARETEMHNLGWKQNRLKHKNFSKDFVDPKGILQNFNVTEAKIERLQLTSN